MARSRTESRPAQGADETQWSRLVTGSGRVPSRRRRAGPAAVVLALIVTVSVAAVVAVALRIVWVLHTAPDEAVAVAPLPVAPAVGAPSVAGPGAGELPGGGAASTSAGGPGEATAPSSSTTVPAAVPSATAPTSWVLPATIGTSLLATTPDPSVTQLTTLVSSYIGEETLGGLYVTAETGAPTSLVILTRPRATDPAVALQQATAGAQVVLGGEPLAFSGVDAGPLGGAMTCAATQTTQGAATQCAWSSPGIVGMVLVYGQEVAAGAESARVIRAAVPPG